MARRFKAQETTIKRDLMNTMKKINSTSLKIEQDEFTGEVKIVFDRANKRYTKICNTYEDSRDNLRAIGLHVEYLYRAVEALGVQSQEDIFEKTLDDAFLSLEATPNDDVLLLENNTSWFNIFGVKSNCDKKDLVNAYKALARVHHPDNGGNREDFIKIRKAYDEGLQSI